MIPDNILMYLTVVLGAIVAIEQVLASVPSLKSNSTFQLICNITDTVVSIIKRFTGPVNPTSTATVTVTPTTTTVTATKDTPEA